MVHSLVLCLWLIYTGDVVLAISLSDAILKQRILIKIAIPNSLAIWGDIKSSLEIASPSEIAKTTSCVHISLKRLNQPWEAMEYLAWQIRVIFKLEGCTRENLLKGKAQNQLRQAHFIQKILFSFVTKQVTLMRRSTGKLK